MAQYQHTAAPAVMPYISTSIILVVAISLGAHPLCWHAVSLSPLFNSISPEHLIVLLVNSSDATGRVRFDCSLNGNVEVCRTQCLVDNVHVASRPALQLV